MSPLPHVDLGLLHGRLINAWDRRWDLPGAWRLAEAIEPVEHRLGRMLCRTLGLHGRGCRGRTNHWPISGRWVRWP